jgi:hypothetical protein
MSKGGLGVLGRFGFREALYYLLNAMIVLQSVKVLVGIILSEFNRHFSLDSILGYTFGIRRPCLLLYSRLFVDARMGSTGLIAFLSRLSEALSILCNVHRL